MFPELTEGERRLGELPGFTPERIEQWLETYPAEVLGLPNHTGSPAAEDPTGNIISTPIPDEGGPNIVEARSGEDYRTPKGNTVRGHGSRGSGEEYLAGKGHSPESVDEIIDFPTSKSPASRGDTSTGGKQGATILFGRNGDWVLINNETGAVIQVNDRYNPRQEPPW
ncbi:MAG: hypothetical protein Q4G26_14180 [Paracoccus sp. (in: a-proteobacteria)]|nr:hypothetical protein [Paracoccus sp. (in: a-proteobacteria)]